MGNNVTKNTRTYIVNYKIIHSVLVLTIYFFNDPNKGYHAEYINGELSR